MSSRRTRVRSLDEDAIAHLLKLQELLPNCHQRRTTKVTSLELLNDVCSYIKNLQGEADQLSKKLSRFLASSPDPSGADVDALLRSLLQQ